MSVRTAPVFADPQISTDPRFHLPLLRRPASAMTFALHMAR